MKTGRYSLKELLTHNEIEQIIIPEIQRDYVWKEDNIIKLLDDIVLKFKAKKNHCLEIKINGVIENNTSVNLFLTKEYERLKYHQKLGFIYAYHDKEYAGKFFLIDGQQRLTTLFLLLLNLYCDIPEKKETFRSLYFNNDILKLDYKVREQSHDFLKLFVNAEIKQENYENSEQFYRAEYLKDTTIISIIRNYEVISKYLLNFENKKELLEYVEDFIEVNYFDTHLSEQGEQLYIYMNSRGEQLSFQEIVRAEMMKTIGTSAEKIQLGEDWEGWQNYFWQNRGENENADLGFEEFLKWAVIIHISLNDQVRIESFSDKDKDYTRKELKEQFVRQFSDATKQRTAILHYLSSSIDVNFLGKLFNALTFVYSLESKYIPLKKEWLAAKAKVIDYVVVLPLLQYCLQNKMNDDVDAKYHIERMSMFLKNITYFEAVAKNPDTFVIDLIVAISKLYSTKSDIVNIFELSNVSDSIKTVNEIEKLNLLKNVTLEERHKWEEFIWNITVDDKLCEFLMGDSTLFFKYLECNNLKDNEVKEKIKILESLKEIVYRVILVNKNSDKLRLFLLSFFNFSIWVGTGNGIDKYSLVGGKNYEFLREWREVFKNSEFISILHWIREIENLDLDVLYDQITMKYKHTDYQEVFLKYPILLKYCEGKKFLYNKSSERVVLLKQTNYSVLAAKEIQCALLAASFTKGHMWMANSTCCVIDFTFDLELNKLIFNKKLEGVYALDFVYHPNFMSWTFSLFKRQTEILDDFKFLPENWLVKNNRLTLDSEVIYRYDKSISFIDNNNKMLLVIDGIVLKTQNLLKSISQ